MANDYSSSIYACKNNFSADALVKYLKKYPEKFTPLTKEEERALINKLMPDHEDELREELFNHTIRYVFDRAKKYSRTTKDYDELISSGLRCLYEAAKRFDITKNIKFITYARDWIFKGLTALYYTNEAKMDLKSISMDSTYSQDDDTARTFDNYVHEYMDPSVPLSSNASSQLSVCETYNIYNDLVKQINENSKFDKIDKEIFEKSFINKVSVREISSDLNIPPQLVNKKKKTMLLNLKLYLRDKYGITSINELMEEA